MSIGRDLTEAPSDIAAAVMHLTRALQKHNLLVVGGRIMIGVDRHTYYRLRTLIDARWVKIDGGEAIRIGDVYFGRIHEEQP